VSYPTSKTQPFCRCCGKPIQKMTRTVFMERKARPESVNSWSRHVIGEAITKADCQRFTNGQVVSVQYGEWSVDPELHNRMTLSGRETKRVVRSFGEWDGESYKSLLFCSDPCAVKMAYSILKQQPNWATDAYRAAVAGKKESVT
jgi:hypothetical protein